jgi:protein-tyrosine phosphatase
MAEGILRSLLPADLAGQVIVISAGTAAHDGMPATAYAVQATEARGIDLRRHRSQELTAATVRESDLILGMEPGHVERVLELAPDAADRTHLITAQGAAQGAEAGRAAAQGIADPIGGALDEYDDTFNKIRSHLLRWLPLIRDAVERSEGVR